MPLHGWTWVGWHVNVTMVVSMQAHQQSAEMLGSAQPLWRQYIHGATSVGSNHCGQVIGAYRNCHHEKRELLPRETRIVTTRNENCHHKKRESLKPCIFTWYKLDIIWMISIHFALMIIYSTHLITIYSIQLYRGLIHSINIAFNQRVCGCACLQGHTGQKPFIVQN